MTISVDTINNKVTCLLGFLGILVVTKIDLNFCNFRDQGAPLIAFRVRFAALGCSLVPMTISTKRLKSVRIVRVLERLSFHTMNVINFERTTFSAFAASICVAFKDCDAQFRPLSFVQCFMKFTHATKPR